MKNTKHGFSYLFVCRKRKKEKAAQLGAIAAPMTRLDAAKRAKKRGANKISVRKQRANQTYQKRTAVNKKRMDRYFRQKAEKKLQQFRRKQAQIDDSVRVAPYTTSAALKKAVVRLRHRLRKIGGIGRGKLLQAL